MHNNNVDLSFVKPVAMNRKRIKIEVHPGAAYLIISKSSMETLIRRSICLSVMKSN